MLNKLFFVINNLQIGGAERVLSILANEFSKQGFNVFIICLNKAEPEYQILPHVKIINLLDEREEENIFNRIKYALLIFLRLFKLVIKEKPTCVISFMTTANLWSGLICSLIKTPYIVSERTTPDHTINSYNFILKRISYILYKNSNAIVIPAKGIGDCIRNQKSFKRLNNFKIIRNPLNEFKSPSVNPVNTKKFILGVGRLSYIKGFDQLIEAYSKINADDVDLLIVGGGSEYENLSKQIEHLGIQQRVKLIGPKDNLQDYYNQAELFVLPSRNEGYPNTLIEAMSFGCACIAMDCEFGPSEIIENEANGILIEPNNICKLTSAMDNLLADESLRVRVASNAKLINQINSIEIILPKWRDLILHNA
ncbi:glycosyltransferase [Sphingobacterium sp. HJSM2_6]|uniref:glycosyltransferase n=1 Tax=Sphingobacterium sp. HJSM2_6 TaxID=3366264 RepID=UPI003BF4FE33